MAQSTSQYQSSFDTLTLENTLEDLSARFIVNLPPEELESMTRVCFQIEQAHWYYEDFVRPSNPSQLPSYTLKKFSLLMFKSCPLLHSLIPSHALIWDNFMAYKERVPVCGAILISEFWDKVLLVKGWQKSASWSFPRGKINKNEPESLCAIREVLEETGFDIASHFPAEQLASGYVEPEGAERRPYYIELVIKEQKIRLYLIPGVHEDTYFETRTRKEISKIDWFKVSDLPTWNKDKKEKSGEKKSKFYMVTPFISHLKLWIDRNRPKKVRKRSQHPRPTAPTPFTAHTHDNASSHHQLPPHLLDATPAPFSESYNPPLVETTSGSSDDTEEDSEEDRRPTMFESTEEGTEALKAFFFGGEPAPAPPVEEEDGQRRHPGQYHHAQQPSIISLGPLSPPPAIFAPDGSTRTPPQMAYDRQSSFVQPKPKATTDQTNKLLALLTNANPVASPPPPKKEKKVSRTNTQETLRASHGPQEGGSLLNSLDHLLGVPDHLQPSAPSPHTSSSPAPSILFADSAPPPEADGFGETHVLTEAERGETERQQKHDALLRALQSVASLPPPVLATPVIAPGNLGHHFKGARPYTPHEQRFSPLEAGVWTEEHIMRNMSPLQQGGLSPLGWPISKSSEELLAKHKLFDNDSGSNSDWTRSAETGSAAPPPDLADLELLLKESRLVVDELRPLTLPQLASRSSSGSEAKRVDTKSSSSPREKASSNLLDILNGGPRQSNAASERATDSGVGFISSTVGHPSPPHVNPNDSQHHFYSSPPPNQSQYASFSPPQQAPFPHVQSFSGPPIPQISSAPNYLPQAPPLAPFPPFHGGPMFPNQHGQPQPSWHNPPPPQFVQPNFPFNFSQPPYGQGPPPQQQQYAPNQPYQMYPNYHPPPVHHQQQPPTNPPHSSADPVAPGRQVNTNQLLNLFNNGHAAANRA